MKTIDLIGVSTFHSDKQQLGRVLSLPRWRGVSICAAKGAGAHATSLFGFSVSAISLSYRNGASIRVHLRSPVQSSPSPGASFGWKRPSAVPASCETLPLPATLLWVGIELDTTLEESAPHLLTATSCRTSPTVLNRSHTRMSSQFC